MATTGKRAHETEDRRVPLAPVPTLEAIWARHGEALEHLARRVLGDDPRAVHAACYRTMVAAGLELAGKASPEAGADLWHWLENIAADACREIRLHGSDLSSVPPGALPDALPVHLRVHLQLRAIHEESEIALENAGAEGPIERAWLAERGRLREAYDRFRHGVAALLLLPRGGGALGTVSPA